MDRAEVGREEGKCRVGRSTRFATRESSLVKIKRGPLAAHFGLRRAGMWPSRLCFSSLMMRLVPAAGMQQAKEMKEGSGLAEFPQG